MGMWGTHACAHRFPGVLLSTRGRVCTARAHSSRRPPCEWVGGWGGVGGLASRFVCLGFMNLREKMCVLGGGTLTLCVARLNIMPVARARADTLSNALYDASAVACRAQNRALQTLPPRRTRPLLSSQCPESCALWSCPPAHLFSPQAPRRHHIGHVRISVHRRGAPGPFHGDHPALPQYVTPTPQAVLAMSTAFPTINRRRRRRRRCSTFPRNNWEGGVELCGSGSGKGKGGAEADRCRG